MKIRNGYVGNSSSSCFICNTKLSETEIKKILQSIVDLWNTSTSILYPNDHSKMTYNEMFNGPYPGGREYDKYLNPYIDIGEHTKDKIIIESAEDNSIPHVFFDFIEETFEGTRCHLG